MVALRSMIVVLVLTALAAPLAGQQRADPDFDASVARPAFPAGEGPTVVIDEAHGNFHTASGNYAPFAALLRSDGYVVVPGTRRFEPGSLDSVDVLVIANANAGDMTDPAFTEAEADVVRDWVRGGGALLLIADHAPFGASAANLGSRFGVGMGKGWVFDVTDGKFSSQLDFSAANGGLGTHAITGGRDSSEQVHLVRTFTGQSLVPPEGAAVLLKLSPSARETPDTDGLNAEAAAHQAGNAVGEHSRAAGGLAQGLAMEFGRGRLVVMGEAAMFSAQLVTLTRQDGEPVTFRAGMNLPGNDNRQLALNVLHWLSGLL